MAGGGGKSFEPSALPWIPCRRGGSGVPARVTAWVNTQELVEDREVGREAGGSQGGVRAGRPPRSAGFKVKSAEC